MIVNSTLSTELINSKVKICIYVDLNLSIEYLDRLIFFTLFTLRLYLIDAIQTIISRNTRYLTDK